MLLKQRNIVVRPETKEKCELEMKKLEHFGWLRVRESANEDGTSIVSFVRDEDEAADKVAAEKKYRSAKVASEYAAAATESLKALRESNPIRKKSVAPAIVFGVLALVFVAIAVAAIVFKTAFTDYIFTGDNVATLGGKWTFFGFTVFNFQNSGLIILGILFASVFVSFALLFAALAIFNLKKNQAKNFEDYDDEFSIENKIAYLEEVKATADADLAKLYSAD